jgi:hypothetical protein
MPQSRSRVLVHLIFSTKDRIPCLRVSRVFLERYQIAHDERYGWD